MLNYQTVTGKQPTCAMVKVWSLWGYVWIPIAGWTTIPQQL